MGKERLTAFTDGVVAIIITIMVLELKVPHGTSFADMAPMAAVFAGYVLSFVYVGIYWNNHHHMLAAANTITGPILWANMHLLFWLSLVPFATAWMGGNHFAKVPVASYGVVMLFAGVAYFVLQTALVTANRELADTFGRDIKGKGSMAIYAVAILLSLLNRWIGVALYVIVALIWLVPDRRLERRAQAAPPR